jgi:hypothetical protein
VTSPLNQPICFSRAWSSRTRGPVSPGESSAGPGWGFGFAAGLAAGFGAGFGVGFGAGRAAWCRAAGAVGAGEPERVEPSLRTAQPTPYAKTEQSAATTVTRVIRRAMRNLVFMLR